MAIDVVWHSPQRRVIRLTFRGNWTVAEADVALNKSIELVSKSDGKLGYLIDMRSSGVIPPGLLVARNRLTTFPMEYKGLMIFVGAPRVLEVIVRIYQHYDPQLAIAFASNIEDAEVLFAERLLN